MSLQFISYILFFNFSSASHISSYTYVENSHTKTLHENNFTIKFKAHHENKFTIFSLQSLSKLLRF